MLTHQQISSRLKELLDRLYREGKIRFKRLSQEDGAQLEEIKPSAVIQIAQFYMQVDPAEFMAEALEDCQLVEYVGTNDLELGSIINKALLSHAERYVWDCPEMRELAGKVERDVA